MGLSRTLLVMFLLFYPFKFPYQELPSTGIEPVTSRLLCERSNRLNYEGVIGGYVGSRIRTYAGIAQLVSNQPR